MREVNYKDLTSVDSITYVRGEDIPFDGVSKDYFEDGGILSCLQEFKNGLLDGETIWFYPNGNISSVHNYKDGLEHGETIYYYPNRIPQRYVNFKNGEYHGDNINYNDNGDILLKTYWDEGTLVD